MAEPLSSDPKGSSPPERDPLVGRQLGDFLVLEKLGFGGWGSVYRVEQRTLGREAVIKVLHPRNRLRPDFMQRFLRESRLASKLDHPYAAHIYAFGAEPDGLFWIAMELVRGTTLSEMLRARGPLPIVQLSQLLDRMAEVVHSAHEQGIVHRDIKPSNVMVMSRAGRLLPKLLDFGLAKVALQPHEQEPLSSRPVVASTSPLPLGETPLTQPPPAAPMTPVVAITPVLTPLSRVEVFYFTDKRQRAARPAPPTPVTNQDLEAIARSETPVISPLEPIGTPTPASSIKPVTVLTPRSRPLGTPQYMAPELWLGHTGDARSDIYALGVLCYECLTGRPPFIGGTAQELKARHLGDPVPTLGAGSENEAVHRVLARAMAKEPDKRHPTALEFATELRAAATLEPTGVPRLPRLDDGLRETLELKAPQPIADCVAAFRAARTLPLAIESLRTLVRGVVQVLGVLSLAARGRAGPGSTRDATDVMEALRLLRNETLPPLRWLKLAEDFARAFVRQRDAHPLPELVSFFFAADTDLPTPAAEQLSLLVHSCATLPSGEEAQRKWLEEAVPRCSRVLTSLGFLLEYPWVVGRADHAQEWMGLRRIRRPELALKAPLNEGEVAVVSPYGLPVLLLHPLVQCLPPSPSAPEELFMLAGQGRLGARLLALPFDFERSDDSVWAWLGRAGVEVGRSSARSAEADHPPYRGLGSFSQRDAENYFGREREAQAFANRLRQRAFLAVVGPSGVGKSSFVQAGVLPLMPPKWEAVVVRPGPTPLSSLVSRLCALGFPAHDLKAELAQNPGALGTVLRNPPDGAAGVVLLVDQFEELLTLCHDADERELYAAALMAAASEPDRPVRVVVTLRDDFLIRAQRLTALRDLLHQSLHLLATPAMDDLVRTLTEPARRRGYLFEDEALPQQMAAEVSEQPGALAILSFTASKLWELRDRQLKQLTRKAYQALGGVGGALGQHAESTLAQMSSDAQRLTREAFRHLVSHEGTRAVLTRQEMHEVLGGGPLADHVLEALIAARLLVSSEGQGDEDRVEVIHEALLTSWPRLVEWQRADGENARVRDQLRAAARQWQDKGRAKGVLWRGDALTEYRLWRSRYEGALTSVEEEFANGSLHEETRGRRIRKSLIAIAMVLLTLGVAILYEADQRALASVRKLHQEQGRIALLAGQPLQALVYLSQAYSEGVRGSGLQYMLGKAMQFARAQLLSLTHEGAALDASLSKDDRLILTASADKTARLWDSQTGKPLMTFEGHTEKVNCAHFSADESQVLTGSDDGTARLWDRAQGTLLKTFGPVASSVISARFTPDGTRVVTSGKDGVLRVWDIESGKLVHALGESEGAQGFIDFSPDGMLVISSTAHQFPFGGSASANIFSLKTGERVAKLTGHGKPVGPALFSPDGKLVAMGENDNDVLLFDTSAWKLVRVLHGHFAAVTALAWSGDSNWLASAGVDRTVHLWDMREDLHTSTLTGHLGTIRTLAFSEDGRQLLSGSDDGVARVWDVALARERAVLYGHAKALWQVSFDHAHQRVITASLDGTVKVWDPARANTSIRWNDDKGVAWQQFGKDSGHYFTSSADGKVLTTWDAATGAKLSSIQFELPKANWPAITPDERLLATWDAKGAMEIRELATQRLLTTIQGPEAGLQDMELDPSGERLATTTAGDKTTRVWGTKTGQPLFQLEHPTVAAFGVFNSTGKSILTGDAKGTVRLWDATSGKLVRVLGSHQRVAFNGDFSVDGRLAATGGGDAAARVWDLATGTQLADLEGHTNHVIGVSFSADGNLLASGSYDGTVKVWDVYAGTLIDTLDVGESVMPSFSRDGKRLAAAGLRGLITTWPLDWHVGSPEEVAHFVQCKVPFALRDNQMISVQAGLSGCD